SSACDSKLSRAVWSRSRISGSLLVPVRSFQRVAPTPGSMGHFPDWPPRSENRGELSSLRERSGIYLNLRSRCARTPPREGGPARRQSAGCRYAPPAGHEPEARTAAVREAAAARGARDASAAMGREDIDALVSA